jgi:hypothetical protein
MESPDSGYVHLRVAGRRFVGNWVALKNIIVPAKIASMEKIFSIPVTHLLHNGYPNQFPNVQFERKLVLQIIDCKNKLPVKPARYFVATTDEIAEDHLKLLIQAIMMNGSCKEYRTEAFEKNLYRAQ